MESSNNNLDSDISIRDEMHVSLVKEVPSSSLPLSLSLSRNAAATTTFAPPPPQQQQQQQQQQQRRHVDANNNNDEHDHHHQDNAKDNANANANANANVDADTLYLCNTCNLMLGRHRFPKKILRNIINRRISSSDEEQNANANTNTNTNANANNITTKTIKTTTTTTDDASHLVVLICHQCRKINGAIRMKQPTPKYTILTDSGKSNSGVTRRPNNWGYCNYLDKLFSMNCYTDIVKLKVFQSAKDISESMAAIYAIFHHSTHVDVVVNDGKRDKKGTNGEKQGNTDGNTEQGNRNKDENKKVLCLCIGDGCTPRTAVLLSFLTKGLWDCVSIDPALSNEWSGDHHHHGSNNINSKSENDTSDSEQTQTQKQKQKQKQVVRGLYGYKGTLKEFVLDSNRPPFTKRTCTASNNNDPHNNNNNNNNNKQDGDNNNNNNNDNENEDKNDYYQHLILLCVHSHARFIEESTVDNIRSLYTDPNPSSTSSSSSSRATLPYCNDINNTPNLSPNTNPPPSTSLLIPTTIVSLPCCPQYRHVRDIGIQPHIKYDDDCVFSACRSVEVWNL